MAGTTGLPYISGTLMECVVKAVPQLIVMHAKGTVPAAFQFHLPSGSQSKWWGHATCTEDPGLCHYYRHECCLQSLQVALAHQPLEHFAIIELQRPQWKSFGLQSSIYCSPTKTIAMILLTQSEWYICIMQNHPSFFNNQLIILEEPLGSLLSFPLEVSD